MLFYADLMGGLISCEFPYIVMIGFGIGFARTNIFHKEGAYSFAKLMVEIFIPIYLFLNICRSTSVETIEKYYLTILSVLFQMFFAYGISRIYAKITNMDIRYRYTWIILNCFVDIKQVHRLMVSSFCYHLKEKTNLEKEYCTDVLTNNFVHVFFQAIFIWYVAFNFIRLDRKFLIQVKNIQKEICIEMKNGGVVDNPNQKIKSEDDKKREIKVVFDKYLEENNIEVNTENQQLQQYLVTPSFYDKISPFNNQEQTIWWKEMIYVIFRSPLIAIFTGFIVGFITPIHQWIFNTKTAVFLFYDTFNSVGQAHIICAFLIIGTLITVKEESSIRFSRKDLYAHVIYKCIIQPYVGVLFSMIVHQYVPDNKVLNFTCFIQWILPTSIEIVAIAVSKDINAKDVCICLAIQWVWLVCLSNFIVLPPFLKVVDMI